MSSVMLTPRMAIVGSVPLRPPQARDPLLTSALLGMFGIGALVLALAADGVLFSFALAAVGVAMLIVAAYAWDLVKAVQPGVLRVAVEGSLRWVPPRLLAVWQLLVGLVGVIPGTLALLAPSVTGEDFGTGQGSVWLTLATVASVVWLVQQVWGWRVPTGLSVSPEGLKGVRGATAVSLGWDQLALASAHASRTGATLHLDLVDGAALTVHGVHIGSDPNVVAAIIEHFRTHPEERSVLADGIEAVRAVEAAQAGAS